MALAPEKKASLFSIKPYGDNLCTPGARYWISCIRLVIIVMALSEAIAWAYLGSLFGKGIIGYIAAGIAFLFVFIIIWIIDVSFVTLDMSKSHYDNAILKKKTSSFWDTVKISTGLLGRVAIVVVSLSISAPFIAQIVFMQDIDNEMEGRNLARVSAVSDSLLAQKDAEIAELDSLILAKEQELVVETAGKGESGNYGFGPVTQAIERNIQRLEDEREEQLVSKDEMQEAFASLSIQEFAQRYNVDLVDNGVQARSAILTSLSQNPEYKTAKRAITAFLAFIFAALVLLKLFQPRSVRIYYNEKLQDLYREYLSGNLNKWIAKEERLLDDGRSQISPLRFEDWSVNTYGVIRNEDIKRRESSKMYNSFKMKIEQLENEKEEVKKMLDPIESEYDQLVTELNALRIEVMKANNDVEQNDRVADEITRQLESIHTDLQNGSFKGQDLVHAVQAKKSTEDRLAQHAEAKMQLKHDQDIANHRYDIKNNEAEQVEELMTKVRANYRYIQEKIDEERLKYTEMIVSGEILGGIELGGAPEQKHEGMDEVVESDASVEEPADPVDDTDVERQDEDQVQHIDETDAYDEEEAEFYDEEGDEVYDENDEEFEVEEVGSGEDNQNREAIYRASVEPPAYVNGHTVVENEEDQDVYVDPFYRDYRYDGALYREATYDQPEEDERDLPSKEDGDGYFEEENEAIKADQEMINRFIWEDDDKKEEENQEAGKEDAESEEENTTHPAATSYTHYPLLVSGMEEEKDKESPIEYVDNDRLERYADSVSMAAYEADQENGTEKKYTENETENEERKSNNSVEVFSPDARYDAPEEMDGDDDIVYSEESNGKPKYPWDTLDEDADDLSEANVKSKRTTYAWDAFESTDPDQRETERDEIVEEGDEAEDQSSDLADPGEAEAFEDSTNHDEPEAPHSGARDPKPGRKVTVKRRLGRTGDWMIG